MNTASARADDAPGLNRLIEALRAAGLPVGAGEAIDAAMVLRHHAAHADAATQSLVALRLKLRPVLCKSHDDRPLFDASFDAWMAGAARTADASPPIATEPSGKAQAPVAAPPPSVPTGGPAAADVRKGDRSWLLLGLAFTVLLLVAASLVWPKLHLMFAEPAITRPGTLPASAANPAPGGASNAEPHLRTDAVDSPTVPTPLPVAPSVDEIPSVRTPVLLLILLLPLLGLVPLVQAPPGLPNVSRQRGTGSLTLEGWPDTKRQRRLVRDLDAASAGLLTRHVRGAVDQREAYARRPLLDLRRTVNATLARGGLLAVHHRFARLRPAYLVLVQARRADDLGVLWALRLRALDTRVTIFIFDADPAHTEPLCVEVGGIGRRLPFHDLPAPWTEQRLIVIAQTGALLSPEGNPWPWVRKARLERWTQRALFTPDEPRSWNARHVAALETPSRHDPGMLVLPFEDNALDAWSQWLVHGRTPVVELAEPQLFPAALRNDETWFVDPGSPGAPDGDPEAAGHRAQALVTQLQAYLGQNGFYWLCACAVPPLIEQPLALLLGEEYFRRCGASEERISAYMARNWRLLVRLPWLRDERVQMPQWLRLLLLNRLPPAIQAELREAVRGALGRRGMAAGPRRGITLAFDAPDPTTRTDHDAAADPRHALMVGFVRDRLTARELVLGMPGEWQRWLPPDRPPRSLSRRWAAKWQRWRSSARDGATHAAALRWALAGVVLATSAIVLLAGVLPGSPSGLWQDLLLTRRPMDQEPLISAWLGEIMGAPLKGLLGALALTLIVAWGTAARLRARREALAARH